eukprot:scaffold4069_cov85-Cyclotella_meneghiniana.AAC.1
MTILNKFVGRLWVPAGLHDSGLSLSCLSLALLFLWGLGARSKIQGVPDPEGGIPFTLSDLQNFSVLPSQRRPDFARK